MDPQHSTPRLRTVQPDPACPMCGDTGVATSWNRHAFDYGTGDSFVELTVSVPVRRCDACEFEYLDEASERWKDEAVCRHLGVLIDGGGSGMPGFTTETGEGVDEATVEPASPDTAPATPDG